MLHTECEILEQQKARRNKNEKGILFHRSRKS
nr:MAG TPA: hypothetical protein [Bacteriophage sp.]